MKMKKFNEFINEDIEMKKNQDGTYSSTNNQQSSNLPVNTTAKTNKQKSISGSNLPVNKEQILPARINKLPLKKQQEETVDQQAQIIEDGPVFGKILNVATSIQNEIKKR
jgi:hypothetical protein